MGYNNHSCIFIRKFFNNLKDFPRKLRVKCRCRLIETKNIRMKCKCPRNCNSLTLSSRKLVRIIIHSISKPHLAQKFLCFFPYLRKYCLFIGFIIRLFLCQKLSCKHNILNRCILRKKIKRLKYKSEMKSVFSHSGILKLYSRLAVKNHFIVNLNYSRISSFKEIQASEQCCLAASGRTDNR